MDGTRCGSSGSERVEVARGVDERAALEYGGARGRRRLRCGGCAAAAARASGVQASGGVSVGEC